MDFYLEDCDKTYFYGELRPKAVRAFLTVFMDQEWKDFVQDMSKAAKTVDEMDEIITHEIQKLWQKYLKEENFIFRQNKKSLIKSSS